MLSPFLFHPTQTVPSSEAALIILPEIFGLNPSIQSVVKQCQDTFHIPTFGLDIFYPLTHEQNSFAYDQTSVEKGIALMHQLDGQTFLQLLSKAKEDIKTLYPNVTHFSVLGFCFGGKLAFLSGVQKDTNRIISFYGGASTSAYMNDKSVIDILCETRAQDSSLRILGLFGASDTSIPEEVRDRIHQQCEHAELDYTELVYEAGHAFFNAQRATYVQAAAEQAWRDLLLWSNGQ